MHFTARPMPIENQRIRHIFQVVVTEYTKHTTGIWFWRRDYPSLKVRFGDKDFTRFRKILEDETSNGEGYYIRPTNNREFEVGFSSLGERDSFAVGEEVEILFSTAGAIQQFFTRAQPFRWDGIQKKQVAIAT